MNVLHSEEIKQVSTVLIIFLSTRRIINTLNNQNNKQENLN